MLGSSKANVTLRAASQLSLGFSSSSVLVEAEMAGEGLVLVAEAVVHTGINMAFPHRESLVEGT